MKRLLVFLLVLTTFGLVAGQSSVYRLRVVSWSCKAFARGVLVQGTVKNISSRPLQDLRASVRVIGPGLRMASNSTALQDRNLMPGEVAPFEVRIRTGFDSVNRCELWFRNPRVVQIASLVPSPR
ncbi:MAG: hypothetical protein KatS3mg074_326 [Meiothermus sp.]|uniref:DUF3426 domain-containing protein n=2 Tax=Meiothermus hypogaeus TaxID=884155 RepID=A0A511R0I8_9DEIN|nr:hypothetical protein [Meiothermus hypogaeus]RIH81044.1 hypothetical protein Mhypo_00084 [Meiothermus hypogaeus]GEM82322.1 hypothetical protein MHY01S_04880 [Meiothermus hypogaeus NBRC 106114]GIW37928.1 MAG: hypothetical protein KatS3mg074_326 [Meiothermus sp.]